MITIIKNLIKKAVFSFITVPVKLKYNSYSQAGEDGILKFLFYDKKIEIITYLDLGTNVPDYGNNTFLFYLGGSRGVCVEADSTLIEKIKQIRPEDKILNIGVNIGNDEEADFYIFNEPSLNTFDKEEAYKRENHGTYKIVKIEKVKLKTLENLIRENFATYPDFLSIDIEGLDLAVLKSLDFEKFPIPIICAETCTYSENHIRPKNHEISNFMISKGYMIYADTYVNTIFVNKKWFININ